jgi:Na+/proline symporter
MIGADWQLLFALVGVVLLAWEATATADFARFHSKDKSKRWLRTFIGVVWFVLYTLIVVSTFSWLRDTAGRHHYDAVGWLTTVNLAMIAMWAALFFGTYHRQRGDDMAWRRVAWVVLLVAFTTAVVVTVLHVDTYRHKSAPTDVAVAFWTWLLYPLWLGVALVWSAFFAYTSDATVDTYEMREPSDIRRRAKMQPGTGDRSSLLGPTDMVQGL